MTVQEQTLLTTVDMSRLLRCSVQSVYRVTRSGALPSIRIGGLIRYRPEQVAQFIEAGERKGPS
ncbi:MAG TPA: helix-turn-helix domain-containing protein [Gaiellaceae bacterium]|jgi:excisionase family DNA binding protein